jgi:hypothetical protein
VPRALRLSVATCLVLLATGCSGHQARGSNSPSPKGSILATELPSRGGGQFWQGTLSTHATSNVTIPGPNHCDSDWSGPVSFTVAPDGGVTGIAVTKLANSIQCAKGFYGPGATEVDFNVTGREANSVMDVRFETTGCGTGRCGFFGGLEVLFLPQGSPPQVRIQIAGKTASGLIDLAHSGDFEGQGASGAVKGNIDLTCSGC